MPGEGLFEVFVFWIESLLKLFDLMKEIPIYENISLFTCFIAMCIISIFTWFIKMLYRTHHLIRWSDNVATYYNPDNVNGFSNFGEPYKVQPRESRRKK